MAAEILGGKDSYHNGKGYEAWEIYIQRYLFPSKGLSGSFLVGKHFMHFATQIVLNTENGYASIENVLILTA